MRAEQARPLRIRDHRMGHRWSGDRRGRPWSARETLVGPGSEPCLRGCVSVARYPTRKRQRLRNFDYSSPGFYFVTICTAGRAVDLVGAVEALVREEMLALSVRFPGATLDEHVVMPDHVHLILQLDGAALPLPRIIQAFKSRTTISSGRVSGMPRRRIWQRGYYDRVIRDDEELRALREYIRNNPLSAEIARRGDKGPEIDVAPENGAGRASSAPTPPSIVRRS